MSVVACYPYRCGTCRHRFLRFRYWISESAAPLVRGAEKHIAATRGAARWRQRRREILLYSSALTLFAFVLYFLTREAPLGN